MPSPEGFWGDLLSFMKAFGISIGGQVGTAYWSEYFILRPAENGEVVLLKFWGGMSGSGWAFLKVEERSDEPAEVQEAEWEECPFVEVMAPLVVNEISHVCQVCGLSYYGGRRCPNCDSYIDERKCPVCGEELDGLTDLYGNHLSREHRWERRRFIFVRHEVYRLKYAKKEVGG